MAWFMNRLGKCSNLAGCLLAYRGEVSRVADGPFVCPECGEALTPLAEEKTKAPFAVYIGLGALLLFLVPLMFALFSPHKATPAKPIAPDSASSSVTTTSSAGTATAPTASPMPVATPIPTSTPVSVVYNPTMPPVATVSAPETINLDTQNAENIQVKKEVLQRIDLMPTISAENKDKLYMSVERARQMGRVMSIPFPSGKTSLGATEIAALKQTILAPQIQKLLNDPTAVFVVLGYADTKGDEKINLHFSQTRADAVLNALKNDCGVANVMHAVAMGGSSLFDEKNLDKNRIAEVWVVLP